MKPQSTQDRARVLLSYPLRPILLEQQRQRTVGEQLAAGLAAGTVVRLVVRVTNPLHLRAADRTRTAELSMHGHAGPKGGNIFREPFAGFRQKRADPVGERLLSGAMQPRVFVGRELLRQCHWRKPR